MEKPQFKFSQNFNLNHCKVNRAELQKKSPMARTQHVAFNVVGSSHVVQPGFIEQFELQFFEGLPAKRRFLYPGVFLGYRGKGTKDKAACDDMVEKLKLISTQQDYQGQLVVLLFGTNDASEHVGPQKEKMLKDFGDRCRALYTKLLEIPNLVLMPTALLPRGYQRFRPLANANMFLASEMVRNVCAELRENSDFSERIRFIDINKNIARMSSDLVSSPEPGVLARGNVHLSALGNKIAVKNLLLAVNMVPSQCLGVEIPARNLPRQKKKKVSSPK